MPHLDAHALSDDPKGMAFLASVLDVPAERPLHRFGSAQAVQVAEAAPVSLQIIRTPERKSVPEAA